MAGRAAAIFASTKSLLLGANPSRIRRSTLSRNRGCTIIYTSGTSGEAKGVMLKRGNVGHMLGCTSGTPRSVDETPLQKQAGTGSRLPLSASLFRGLLDHDADLPAARQPADAEYGSDAKLPLKCAQPRPTIF